MHKEIQNIKTISVPKENLPPMWQQGGTAHRILGTPKTSPRQSPVINGARKKDPKASRKDQIKQKLNDKSSSLSNKQRKRLKNEERKLSNDERKRNEKTVDNEQREPIVADFKKLAI